MMQALPRKGYEEQKDWVFVLDKKARHFESNWAIRFPDALRQLNNHLKSR
jgi:hypothetical protein